MGTPPRDFRELSREEQAIDLLVMFRIPGERLSDSLSPSLSLLHPNPAGVVNQRLSNNLSLSLSLLHPNGAGFGNQLALLFCHRLRSRLGLPLALAQPPPARTHGRHCSPRTPSCAPLHEPQGLRAKRSLQRHKRLRGAGPISGRSPRPESAPSRRCLCSSDLLNPAPNIITPVNTGVFMSVLMQV